MLAARCRDGCPATTADFVAALRPSALTGRAAAAMAAATTDAYPSTIPTRITTSGSSTAAASSATSATCAAATAFGQRGTYRQSRDCENQPQAL